MNRNVLEIIDALTAHEDTDSIRVLEEIGNAVTQGVGALLGILGLILLLLN